MIRANEAELQLSGSATLPPKCIQHILYNVPWQLLKWDEGILVYTIVLDAHAVIV